MNMNDVQTGAQQPISWQMYAVIKIALDVLTRRWSGEPKDLPAMWQFLFRTTQPSSLWSGTVGDAYWELYPEGRFVRYRQVADGTMTNEAAIFSWNADDNREVPQVAAVKLMMLVEAARRVLPKVDLDSFLGSALNNLMNREGR